MLQRLKPRPQRVMMTIDSVGGVWRYGIDLARSLKQFSVEFLFVGLGPEPSPAQRQEAETLGKLVWLDAPLDWLVEDESALDAVPRALEALAEEADLIHLNAPSQAAGLRADVPTLAVSHSCVPTWFATVRGCECPSGWSWQHRRNRAGLLAADVVVAPSRSHAQALEACYGDLAGLTVVFNGSRPASASRQAKKPFVMAAGRWWDEGKNGAALDRAAPEVQWPIRAAGSTDGPAQQSFTFNHAEALGSVPAETAQAYLDQAAIVVSPSLYEPFGLVPLEGAKAAAALVLSDIPTYRELWDGAAVFADPTDPVALAGVINELVADPERRQALGIKAQERSSRFTLGQQAESMWEVYRTLTPQHAR